MSKNALVKAIEIEIRLSKEAEQRREIELAKVHLGRAHILSQKRPFTHVYIHILMLFFSLRQQEPKEILGQLLRVFVTIPGHLLGRVPKGNIGWASVGLTEEMEVPADLKALLLKPERNAP